jgi:hypothetical protein
LPDNVFNNRYSKYKNGNGKSRIRRSRRIDPMNIIFKENVPLDRDAARGVEKGREGVRRANGTHGISRIPNSDTSVYE